MRIMAFDYESFIAGIQVGRRLKAWDSNRVMPIPPEQRYIVTEDGDPIVTESGDNIVTEQVVR